MTITYDKQVLIKRGNTASTSAYVGPLGELVLNTDTNRVYVHNGATVGGTLVGDGTSITYSNINVAAYIPTDATITSLIANAGVQSANIAILTANAATQAGQIGQLQTDVTTANTNMKNYVDSSISANVTAIINGAPGALDTLNELANALGNNASFSTTITNSLATLTSNAAVQAGLIAETNTAITTANLAMKGYVDSQSFYSNAKVASYLPTYSGNIKVGTVIFDDLSEQDTAYTGVQWRSNLSSTLITKPSWLSLYPDGQKTVLDTNYGFDAGGMWFYGNSDNEHAYPVRTNLHLHDSDVLEVIATINFAHTGDDHGIAVFSSSATPIWKTAIDTTRIAFQFNSGIPVLYGQTTSNTAPGSPVLVAGNYYTVKFTYDPTNTVTVETYSGNTATGLAIDTRTISEILPAGDYVVGFDADQDVEGNRSYFTNLIVRTLTNTVVNDLEILGTVTGDLIPSANVTYDLGSSTARWNDLWLSGNTIHLGSATLSVSGGAIQSSLPIAANLTATNITVTGTRIEFASGGYIEEAEVLDGNASPLGYYGIALNSSDDGIISMNALDSNAIATSSVIVSNVLVQVNVANSTPGGNALIWAYGSDGALTLPAGGIITTPDAREFQLQAKDTNSLLRNEINLDPNNGTYMSVWSEELNTAFSADSWATASWQNNGGQGYAIITNAEDLADFWTTGVGSFVNSIEVSINGGARTPVQYYGDNEEQYDVELLVTAIPGSTTEITSLIFYYQTKSSINIDYDNGQMLFDAQSMNITLETSNDIDLRSGGELNLRSVGQDSVRIYTDNSTYMWDFNTTGSLTLPQEGKIFGLGLGPAGPRGGYMSWAGNSSAGGLGFNTMRLVPDEALETFDQYIILDPTYVDGEPGSISIRAGGTQDNSLTHLYLGGANSHVKISAGLNSPVTVMSNNNSWDFGNTGNLTLPAGGTITEGVVTDNPTIELTPANPDDASQKLVIKGGLPPEEPADYHLHLTTGDLDLTSIILGTDYHNVRTTTDGKIQITTPTEGTNVWEFDTTGALTFPDDTVQTTAWTGAATQIANGTSSVVVELNGNINFTRAGYNYGHIGSGVALGYLAGNTNQGLSTVAIGTTAGQDNQGLHGVAIGTAAGYTGQSGNAVAIGNRSGQYTQGQYAVAIGALAGNTNQGGSAVAVGSSAGATAQGISAVAVGSGAAFEGQGNSATALGASAASYDQNNFAIAIGAGAGYSGQGTGAIAIGADAATLNQGEYSIAIGAAISTNAIQPNNSIIIDATASQLAATGPGLFISPVRQDDSNIANIVYYNTSTKEITYSSAYGNTEVNAYLQQLSSIAFVASPATISGVQNFVTSNANVTSTLTAGSINVAGDVNLTGAEGSDTARIFADVSGTDTSLVLEVGDDSADSIVLRHYSYAAGTTLDMLTATRSSNIAATVSVPGNITATGTITGNVLKIEDGVHEAFQTKADATGVVEHDCSQGHIFYHTSPDANWTANFANLNLGSGYATSVSLIITQGGTGYYPNVVQIGGAGQTINWQGNTLPTPSTNRTDVATFSIINNSSTYTVLGQLTGF